MSTNGRAAAFQRHSLDYATDEDGVRRRRINIWSMSGRVTLTCRGTGGAIDETIDTARKLKRGAL